MQKKINPNISIKGNSVLNHFLRKRQWTLTGSTCSCSRTTKDIRGVYIKLHLVLVSHRRFHLFPLTHQRFEPSHAREPTEACCCGCYCIPVQVQARPWGIPGSAACPAQSALQCRCVTILSYLPLACGAEEIVTFPNLIRHAVSGPRCRR